MLLPTRFTRALWLGALAGAVSVAAADDAVDKVGKIATQWVQARAETVRLETEWSGQRELLAATVTATEERAVRTEDALEQAKAKTAQARGEFETLERKNEAAQKNLAAAAGRLQETSRHLLALRSSLPPRLQAALTLPYRSLEDKELPAGDRMQHTMTILNRCLQFNHVVTVGEEELTLPGEPAPRELEVIYWGLSHGYALDRQAKKAWLGTVGTQGWQWELQANAAGEVARLIAVATDHADPAFVVVPAKLGHVQR